MAFQLSGWARVSVSANEPVQSTSLLDPITNVVIAVNGYVGSFREYNYYSAVVTVAADVGTITGDATAAIAAPGYFNNVFHDIQVGDIINVYSAFDLVSSKYVVTAVGTATAPNVVLAALGAGGALNGSLTAAQIVAMYAAPVAIPGLPAPGAGLAYVIDKFTLNNIFGTAALTDGGNISLEYGNAAHAAGPLASGTIAAGVATAAANAFGITGGASVEAVSADIDNIGIFISNDTEAFANGAGSTDVFNYSINFRVVAIS